MGQVALHLQHSRIMKINLLVILMIEGGTLADYSA
jgi:hypothetical protein